MFNLLFVKNKKMKFVNVFSHPDSDPQQYTDILDRKIKQRIDKIKPNEIIAKKEDSELNRYLGIYIKRAKKDREERGINVLYLSLGLLEWYENKSQKEPNYSPLLFIPINLTRKNVFDNYRLQLFDEEVIPNELIMNLLQKDFNVKLPKLPDYIDVYQLTMYLKEVSDLISSLNGWKVHQRMFIGIFSFSSIRLYKDMSMHQHHMYNHPIIRSIAEGNRFTQENIPGADDYGDTRHPSLNFSVLDNDSSQERAIQYAMNGVSMIIKGPPGTGKSQTITNIIAEGLSKGKKILFVAQKMAALDVVKSRLDNLGLGHFCLELHSHEANKRSVLEQIKHSLGIKFEKPHLEPSFYEQLQLVKEKLNEYTANINSEQGKIGISLFHLIGKYMQYNDVPLVKARLMDMEDYDVRTLFEIHQNLANFNRFVSYLQKDKINNPWAEFEVNDFNFNPERTLDKINILQTMTSRLDKLYRGIRSDFQVVLRVEDLLAFHSLGEIDLSVFDLDLDSISHKYNHSYKSALRVFKPSYHKSRKKMNQMLSTIDDNQIRSKLDLLHWFKYDVFHEKFNEYNRFNDFVSDCIDILSQIKQTIKDLRRDIELGIEFRDDTYISDIREQFVFLFDLADHEDELRDWHQFNYLSNYIDNTLGIDFLHKISKLRKGQFLKLERIFDRRYYQLSIDKHLSELDLDSTDTEVLDELVNEFREIDESSLQFNLIRLLDQLFTNRNESMSNTFLSSIKSSEISLLEKELAKKSRIKPLRQIFTETRNYLVQLKPAWLMSPLSIANYLPGDTFFQFFDIVIFDEASQIPPHEAIGTILRGKQVIIVGDEKQMPPTAFFGGFADYDDDGGELHAYESILDELSGVGLPEIVLQWHYRSKKERLITFSNFHYYDNQLNTFPDTLKLANSQSDDVDLLPAHEFRYVSHGLYDRGGTRKNVVEAKEVVSAIINHFNTYQGDRRFSLGIITFSSAQAEAIEQELERRMREDKQVLDLIGKEDNMKEPIFIKNLENVQGDERDFIFFSLGYGNDKTGKMTKNFGPLNHVGGERRLNVAITRARYHTKIFSSFDPDLVDCSNISSIGFNHLMSFMKFVKNNETLSDDELSLETEFPFEDDVANALTNFGYQVDRKVGTASYKIDIAVVNPSDPSRYILAIECDGGSYASSKTTRDRVRIRNNVLISLGWQVYHLWSLDWFRDRETQLVMIRDYIEDILENEMTKPIKAKTNDVSKLLTSSIWEVEKLSKTQKRDPRYRKQYLNLAGVSEYQVYQPQVLYDKEDIFNEELFSRVKAEIISVEGPIHRDLLISRLLQVFKKPKRNRQLRDFLSIEVYDEFHYPQYYEGKSLRIALDHKDDPRGFDQIPEEELKYAILLILNEILTCQFEDLLSEVLNLIGIKSRNAKIVSRITSIIEMMEGDYIIDEMEGQISLAL